MIGRVLSRYKILEEVGQGGMAVVYRGLDTSLGREVAVKVLHPHLAGHAESRARLEREAQAVAKLRHENILEIFDYSGSDSAESFIVTEFIHGPTLTSFVKQHPIELPEVAAMIASEVARALDHAHSLGVIHRDVKPENVMIANEGLLKLTDFGIAQIVDKERMTVTGQLLGSPAYMSPEHVEGGRLDFRTDVFALGILTYQLATGMLPFRGKNPHEVLKKIADCQFTPPDQVNPLVSGQLSRIITRALARSPDARHPTAGAFRNELCAELASVGVDDSRGELRAYFAAPEEWTRAFRPRLVAALVAAGKKFATRGRSAAALAAWSRALTLEPEHEEARSLIDGLGQRRRNLRIALGAAALLAVGGSAVAAVHYAIPSLRSNPDGGAGAMHATRLPATATSPNRPAPAITAHPPTVVAASNPSPRPHPIAVHPPAARRLLNIKSVQKQFEVLLDGKSLGTYENPIDIGPGRHQLTLRNGKCCDDVSTEIAAEQTETPTLKLPWKTAYLDVRTDPEDATISFFTDANPSEMPSTSHLLAISFPHTWDNGEMGVHLSVRAAGWKTVDKVCKARAGKTLPCAVDLLPRAD